MINDEQIQALLLIATAAQAAPEWYPVGSYGDVVSIDDPKWSAVAEFVKTFNAKTVREILATWEADKALIAELQQGCENDPRIHEIIDLEEQITETNDALCKLLPGVQYMDPPDGGNVTPLEQVSRMVADYRQQIAELSAHLRNAHSFIENTEAFGGEAATGIIKCGGAEWDIDASKAALVGVEN